MENVSQTTGRKSLLYVTNTVNEITKQLTVLLKGDSEGLKDRLRVLYKTGIPGDLFQSNITTSLKGDTDEKKGKIEESIRLLSKKNKNITSIVTPEEKEGNVEVFTVQIFI